jgi:DnaJ-class molecular chaperone
MTIITCPRCHGGRREQFQDHRGIVVVRICSRCRGAGELIIKDGDK